MDGRVCEPRWVLVISDRDAPVDVVDFAHVTVKGFECTPCRPRSLVAVPALSTPKCVGRCCRSILAGVRLCDPLPFPGISRRRQAPNCHGAGFRKGFLVRAYHYPTLMTIFPRACRVPMYRIASGTSRNG